MTACAKETMMHPYWQSPDGTITVYCARWEDVHAAGAVGEIDLTHADPPYGVNERTGVVHEPY